MKFIFAFALAVSSAAPSVVTDWNTAALDAIRATNTPPPAAARSLAILHASIYDAVNGIRDAYQPYLVTEPGPHSASVEVAAAAAARRVLITLFPTLQASFESRYQSFLATVPANIRTVQGTAWGDTVAVTILQRRSTDGSTSSVTYTPGTLPGQWRPTISFGGEVRPELAPHWGLVQPFAIPSASQFRPPAPPALDGPEYTAEWTMVRDLGAFSSATRTSEQTEIALFWGYGPRTATPPGHWNEIAQAVIRDRGSAAALRGRGAGPPSIVEHARLFALLNFALAVAAIVSWDCKYAFNYWRPITAIREADTDGNPATTADPAGTPLLPTPPFPECTSGHSTFSGAAAAVLAGFFGSDAVPFTVGSDDLPGMQRSYRTFSQAADESGVSRIYGGIHFMSANRLGLATGAAVGTYVGRNLLRPRHSSAGP